MRIVLITENSSMQYYVNLKRGSKSKKGGNIMFYKVFGIKDKSESEKAVQILKNHGIEFQESFSPLELFDLDEALFRLEQYTLLDDKGSPRRATMEEIEGLAYELGESWDKYIDGEFISELTVEYMKKNRIKYKQEEIYSENI